MKEIEIEKLRDIIATIQKEKDIQNAENEFFKKEQMKVLQNYETLANIISMALGGGKKEADRVYDVENVDQLQNALGSALNGKG